MELIDPESTASSSRKSLIDRVNVGGSASMQSPKVVHTAWKSRH